MKKILAIGMVAFLGFSVCAQNEKSELPPQLVQLKKGYEVKVKAAVDPIKREYKTALNKLLKQYGASGNIKFAVLVQKELDQLNDLESEIDLKTFLVGTTWTWQRDGLNDSITFATKDSISGSWTGKWKIVPNSNKIKITHKDQRSTEVEFAADGKFFFGFDFDGKNRIKGELISK